MRVPEGEKSLGTYSALREIFRSDQSVQGMGGGDAFGSNTNPDHVPVFYLDGEPHRRRRKAIARYFTPQSIATRYAGVIHGTSDQLMADLQRDGKAVLDEIAFQMAVDVTAEVVGINEGDNRGQAARLRKMLDVEILQTRNPMRRKIGMIELALRMQ